MPNVMQASFHKRRGIGGLERVTVRQKFGNHTITFLDYRIGDRREYLLPPENAMGSVQWGVSPLGVRTFYGYVNHKEMITNERGEALTRLVMLGTSKTMNAAKPSSWRETSRSSVVRDIAARHRLRSVIHNHEYVMDTWATGTRSDFAALRDLADEIGYRFWVDGATVWFLDPLRVVRTASSMTTPMLTNRAVRSMQILAGSNIPGDIEASKRRIQYGLDSRTNEFFEVASGNPLDPVEVVPNTVTTLSEANQTEEAGERRRRDTFVLKAAIDGDARLHPGGLLMVESGRVNTDQAGVWLVNEAVHEISFDDFTSRIVGTREDERLPVARVTSTLRGADSLARAVIRDELTWEAALQEHLHV